MLPVEPAALARIDEALGVEPGTITELRDGTTDPLNCEPRPLALLGRATDLDLETWIGLISTRAGRGETENRRRIWLLREAWERAEEDDP